MKKLLITGASGFIGRHVVEKLVKTNEYDVTAVISGKRDVAFSDCVLVERADLLNSKECENLFLKIQPQVCCHFAWDLGKGGFLTSDKNLDWLQASIHLAKLFVDNCGEKFFFAGSSSDYGMGDKGNAEDFINTEYSLYGQCKLAFEQVAKNYCLNRNVTFITGRYFSVYGPWDLRLDAAIPTAISSMMQGKDFTCKAPNNLWDFVYVRDCANATVELLSSGNTGEYNIASGQPIRMKEAFSVIARELRTEHLLHFDEKNCYPAFLTADISKLKNTISFAPISFEQGIRETIQWWRSRCTESS